MEKQKDQRRWPRETIEPPKSGIIYPKSRKSFLNLNYNPDTLHVNVLNMSKKGLLLQSPLKFKVSSSLDMRIWHPHKKVWMAIKGRIKWVNDSPSKHGYYLFGVEFHRKTVHEDTSIPESELQLRRMSPSDLEFLLNTNLFNAIPPESICPLLNSLTFKHINKAERFITQGDEGDCLYIIRSGSCIVNLEKDNTLHPIARLKAGDVVGEMAVLTGERRSTHVDAETDMELWSLSRAQFDALSHEYPDLRDFLTDIVTHRFSVSKLTAFRNIGKYIIKEIIGQGGWSIVYKGVHGKLNFPVAIKMMRHNMAMNPEFLDKFQNEAKIIARLNHPNIIKVYDIEDLYRTVFIIMEYLEGLSLEYLLENMPKLPLPKILDIIMQICSGLAYAHKEGIIHQDIKPANIYIRSDERVKIVDFGLACPPGSMDFNLSGTVFYMSPEQIQGEPVDERTDIYSLGITAYEMLIGKRPFPEDDIAKLLDFHITKDVPDPRIFYPDLPDELHYFITKSICKNPSARLKNISEVIKVLQPLAEKLGLTPQQQKKEKMLGMFLFYNEEQQLILNSLIDKFNSNIADIGAELRIAPIEDV